MGFDNILIHGKNNYVMDIDNTSKKLSEHKKAVELSPEQWGCNKPQAFIRKEVMTITGLDGRKMSKSYNNVIPKVNGKS